VTPAPDLPAALAAADVVSVHVPMADGPVLGRAELARLKPDAVVVNTARGGVVDEAALAEALAAGQLGAAGLDVFGAEPPPADHPLVVAERVVLSPHNAGLTAESAERMAVAAAQNVLDHFAGRLDPALVVNLKPPRLPSDRSTSR
jgi:D-3-phosphoglycerate dehydrogenase